MPDGRQVKSTDFGYQKVMLSVGKLSGRIYAFDQTVKTEGAVYPKHQVHARIKTYNDIKLSSTGLREGITSSYLVFDLPKVGITLYKPDTLPDNKPGLKFIQTGVVYLNETNLKLAQNEENTIEFPSDINFELNELQDGQKRFLKHHDQKTRR